MSAAPKTMTDASNPWQPTASLTTLKARAELYALIRNFFSARDIMEVDTPALSPAGNPDPHIESFITACTGPGMTGTLFLQTSPEFAMKRLLAAGSGAIYQLCKVFRNGEAGRWHNPEFTLLEWYRPKWDMHALMDEVTELVSQVLAEARLSVRKISYQQAFMDHLSLDPLCCDCQQLQEVARQHGLTDVVGMATASIDDWLDLLMDQVVVPAFDDGMVFVFDYPASQAALAKISPENTRVAQRFELFINGVELANGFHELTDAREQRQRFEADNTYRLQKGQAVLPVDENLLAALEYGLPDCSGVALGVDRLLMIKQALDSITDVLTMPSTR